MGKNISLLVMPKNNRSNRQETLKTGFVGAGRCVPRKQVLFNLINRTERGSSNAR